MTDDGLNRCYNRGCGKMYSDEDNHEKACRFHPGDPYFHDAYKGWSCCQKKSVDFTEFLNIAGCTVSFHSNVKPSEPEKPAKGKPMPPGEVLTVGSEKRMDKSPVQKEERPRCHFLVVASVFSIFSVISVLICPWCLLNHLLDHHSAVLCQGTRQHMKAKMQMRK
eukprot:m.121234 g.121234  ORF g.121234 m.121234 type:complete len:165 (+) comp37749_c2_seq55:228-722(+)